MVTWSNDRSLRKEKNDVEVEVEVEVKDSNLLPHGIVAGR